MQTLINLEVGAGESGPSIMFYNGSPGIVQKDL